MWLKEELLAYLTSYVSESLFTLIVPFQRALSEKDRMIPFIGHLFAMRSYHTSVSCGIISHLGKNYRNEDLHMRF